MVWGVWFGARSAWQGGEGGGYSPQEKRSRGREGGRVKMVADEVRR